MRLCQGRSHDLIRNLRVRCPLRYGRQERDNGNTHGAARKGRANREDTMSILLILILVVVISATMNSSRIDHAQELHETDYRRAVEDIARWNRKHDRRKR